MGRKIRDYFHDLFEENCLFCVISINGPVYSYIQMYIHGGGGHFGGFCLNSLDDSLKIRIY